MENEFVLFEVSEEEEEGAGAEAGAGAGAEGDLRTTIWWC